MYDDEANGIGDEDEDDDDESEDETDDDSEDSISEMKGGELEKYPTVKLTE